MAEIFHGRVTANAKTGLPATGAWVPLPALPAGVDPMRRIIMRATGTIEFGYCTAGTTVQDAEVFCTGGATGNLYFARDCGVLDYSRITVRSTSTTTPYDVDVFSHARNDQAPRGM